MSGCRKAGDPPLSASRNRRQLDGINVQRFSASPRRQSSFIVEGAAPACQAARDSTAGDACADPFGPLAVLGLPHQSRAGGIVDQSGVPPLLVGRGEDGAQVQDDIRIRGQERDRNPGQGIADRPGIDVAVGALGRPARPGRNSRPEAANDPSAVDGRTSRKSNSTKWTSWWIVFWRFTQYSDNPTPTLFVGESTSMTATGVRFGRRLISIQTSRTSIVMRGSGIVTGSSVNVPPAGFRARSLGRVYGLPR